MSFDLQKMPFPVSHEPDTRCERCSTSVSTSWAGVTIQSSSRLFLGLASLSKGTVSPEIRRRLLPRLGSFPTFPQTSPQLSPWAGESKSPPVPLLLESQGW
jgi:hypothetical protein